jgi:hypothetical protein
MTLEKYAQDIYNYLTSKIPGIEPHTAAEVAEFAAMKTYNFSCDALTESNKMWSKEFERSSKSWEKLLRKSGGQDV